MMLKALFLTALLASCSASYLRGDDSSASAAAAASAASNGGLGWGNLGEFNCTLTQVWRRGFSSTLIVYPDQPNRGNLKRGGNNGKQRCFNKRSLLRWKQCDNHSHSFNKRSLLRLKQCDNHSHSFECSLLRWKR
uniref:Secreted protein n=1 Tax=Timema bartmani TaxID=61472 RepID=A0A7R9EZ17_9NEOP|nr:unnamed protein product [Timema bartmani]